MTTLSEVLNLADDLIGEELGSLGEPLARAHEDVIGSAEMRTKWRFYIAAVLADPRPSAATRAKAMALHRELDAELR